MRAPLQVCPFCGKRIAPPPRLTCPFCRKPLPPGQGDSRPEEPRHLAPPDGVAAAASPLRHASEPTTMQASAPRTVTGLPSPWQPHGAGPAWEDRQRLGFGPALLDTIRAVALEPTSFYASMPKQAGIGAPLSFGVLVGSLALVALFGTVFLFALLVQSVSPPSPPQEPMTALGTLGAFAFWAVVTPFGVLLTLFLEAGMSHLVLLVIGGPRQTFETTFRVSCYARAVTLSLVVPVAGWIGGGIWLVVNRILGLATSHGCGGGRATTAVLAPPLACCCLQGLLYFLFFSLILAAAAGATAR